MQAAPCTLDADNGPLLDLYTGIPYIDTMDVVFIETPEFVKKVDRFADFQDMIRLQNELKENPYRGDIIRGTGGARKIRMRIGSSGKSGGARVIFYFVDMRGEIWLLDIYPKNEKEDLSESDKKKIFKFIKETIQ